MLKRTLQKIILEQKGQMLPIVLVLMLLSGLLIVPTLKYASSSLKVKQVTEKKTLELYAADSGVEDALSYLPQFPEPPPAHPPHASVGPWEWDKKDDPYWKRNHYDINGKTVDVTVMRPTESQPYKITSKATSTDDAGGSNTTVTSYVEFTDFSCLFDNLVTTQQEDITVLGNPNITGNLVKNYPGPWPRADDLKRYYRKQVIDEGPPYEPGLTVTGNYTIDEGGLYSDVGEGGEFVIEGADNLGYDKLTLNETNGTVYIKGNLQLGSASGNFFTLDLNGQTIFVEGEIKTGNQNAFAVNGTGCIIAVGLIEFAPGIEFNPNEFVFIMSLETVTIWPNADFNGAIATPGDVTLHSGTGTYTHTTAPDALKLSFLGGTDAPITILSWQIS